MVHSVKRFAALVAYQFAIVLGLILLAVSLPLSKVNYAPPYNLVLSKLRSVAFDE